MRATTVHMTKPQTQYSKYVTFRNIFAILLFMKQPIHKIFRDRVILLFIAGLFFFFFPSRIFWASSQLPWFTPYIVWFFLIALTWLLYRWLNRNES